MKFYANPYNTDATGFYFETYEEFTEKMEEAKDSFGNQVEEFMIDVIDGPREELQLVDAIKIDQGNVEEVMEYIDTSDEDEWPKVFFLLDNNIYSSLSDAKDNVGSFIISQCTLEDAAQEAADEEIGCIPKKFRDFVDRYFDYKQYAYDKEVSDEFVEFEFGGKTYTCTNANQ